MKYIQSLFFALLFSLTSITFAGSINLNTADSETLMNGLSGIGESKALAIIEYRDKNGPFKSIDELSMVKGIGDATLEKNRDKLAVE